MGQKSAPSLGKIQFVEAQHIGYGQQRQSLEDRCASREFKTAGGLDLTVGVVADGIGGANAGEVAGQLGVDTVLNYLKSCAETDIEHALFNAVQRAHVAVVQTSRSNPQLRSMGATLTIAAISAEKLYVAHVGDSRAYLVRDGKILQLTLDQSWGKEKIRTGQLTAEQAAKHARKDELARFLGQQGTLEIDIGLRLDNEPDPAKSVLTQGGMDVLPGDTILICSDGLIKDQRGNPGVHYVEPAEIVNTIYRNEPQDSANTLVAMALGRQVDDNVSVVILEVPGKKKRFTQAIPSSKQLFPIIAIILALLTVIIGSVVLLGGNSGKQTAKATMSVPLPDQGTAQAIQIDGTLQYLVPGQNPQQLTLNQTFPAGEDVKIWALMGISRIMLSDGSEVYLDKNTTLYLKQVADVSAGREQSQIKLEKGHVLIKAEGKNFRVSNVQEDIYADVKGSLMGVEYDQTSGRFFVNCLEGECNVTRQSSPTIPLSAGTASGYEKGVALAIGQADYITWGLLGGAVVPTPTFTPTAVPTATATITPTPTATVPPVSGTPIPASQPSGDDDDDNNNKGKGGGKPGGGG